MNTPMPSHSAPTRKHIATNRCRIVLFSLVILSGMLPRQEHSLSQSSQEAPYTVRVSVDMVVLHATVIDRKGIPVSDLAKENFRVYENGTLQQIEYFTHEDIPVTVGIVVDNSGTMMPKRREVIASALAFARSSNPEDEMFVIHFNENVSFGLPDNIPFTDQLDQLELALSRINANGMTALYDALAIALHHLQRGSREKKVLIVISDGGDNASKQKLNEILSLADRSNAIIYTIGIFDANDPDRNVRALKQLAEATGGESFLPGTTGEIISICKRIAHDIRNQYSIFYFPTNTKQDGSYRAIQVRAGAPQRSNLLVRTRAGYHAPLKLQAPPAAEQPCEDPP